MKLNRRRFLKSALALGVMTPVAAGMYEWLKNTQTHEFWLSAQGKDSKHFSMGWISKNDQTADTVHSDFRGHGLVQNPVQLEQVVMFSRSPGNQALVVNMQTGCVEKTINCLTGHHMHGHGCFSLDGQKLYVTESNYQSGEGKISVYEFSTGTQIGQFPSYGVGPHEILLMPDGDTLVVANGGLRTHPDSGRKVLNLESMRSSLAYINRQTGQLISEHTLKESKASIRHLDVANDGTVALAIQVQRDAMSGDHVVPLTALHKMGEELRTLKAPSGVWARLNDYIGSVRISNRHRTVAFTSPKGDMVLFWQLDRESLQDVHVFHDVCGLTLSAGDEYFVISNSSGKIRQIHCATFEEDRQKRLHFKNMQWDNHMLTVHLTA